MENITKKKFFNITKKFSHVPFTQSEGFYYMHSLKNTQRFIFFADNITLPTIACMANIKKFANKSMLQIEGECLLTEQIDENIIYNFYSEITKTGYEFIEINSSIIYSTSYEIGIRRAGFLRPVGLFSTALTILVNLTKPIEYNKNWEKNIKKACHNRLSFCVLKNPSKTDFEDYLAMEKELKQRKNFHNSLYNLNQIEALFSKGEFQLFFVENEQKKRLAGIIIYTHNLSIISVYSVATTEGRKVSAAYFLRKEMLSYMAKRGVTLYDMGRISPSKNDKNGLYLFKNGIKGECVVFNGEWSWYKRPIYRPIMYFVKKYLFKWIEV